MDYRVLCTDGFAEAGQAELRRREGFAVDYRPKLSHDELLGNIEPFDALIVRSASHVDRAVIERGKNLKVIARAGVGTDNIDVEAATERGILVVNAPAGNTISTAELAFTMILSLARHVPQAARLMAEGRWEKKKFKGNELAHKTIGIIGMGRIGREVARRAQAFQMRVLGLDPNLPANAFESLGAKRADLEEILKESDYVTIHSPLTKETENMISAREIGMMKPTAYLINCARGGIVNERDLAGALREGIIAGAALDVFTREPFDDPMFKGLDNVILTPHLGASTSEAQEAVAVEAAAAVAQYLSEGMGPNAVNLAGADGNTWRKFRSHIHIAEKIGSMAAQLAGGRARKISFLSAGGTPRIIALAAIKGAIQKSADDQVTIVNAEKIARESGVAIADELVSEKADFADSLGVRIETDGSRMETWGAVLADGSTKIVRLGEYRVEIDPRGTILFIHNQDKPGVIGRIATILGGRGVNIAEMQNVRKRQGEEALTVIGVDGVVEAQTLEEIRREDGVTAVSLVSL